MRVAQIAIEEVDQEDLGNLNQTAHVGEYQDLTLQREGLPVLHLTGQRQALLLMLTSIFVKARHITHFMSTILLQIIITKKDITQKLMRSNTMTATAITSIMMDMATMSTL